MFSHFKPLNCWIVIPGLLLSLGLSACTPAASIPILVPPTARGRLTPFYTPTPSRTPSPQPTPTSLVELPVTPLPTATPFLHTIAKGDTLLGIAIKYGLKLEDLQAANPEVDANLLVIGQALIIPLAGVTTPTPIATPTPAPAALSAPHCYPAADGGLWCLLLARNEGPLALENLSAWVGLFSVSGEAQASQVAVSPLNLLPAGQAAPLAAYFSAPAPAEATPRAGLLTALTVPVSDTRYLTATLQIDALEIDASGLQATVEGQVKLPAGGPPAAVVWVAAVAYDAQEQPVGIRKWEAHAPCPAPVEGSPMPPCGPVPFNLTVYSLGPAIARIEVLIEARP